MSLKTMRKQHGLSRGDLASLLNVSNRTIAHYEEGTRRPRPEIAERIGDLFNLDGKELWSMFYSGKESEVPVNDSSPADP